MRVMVVDDERDIQPLFEQRFRKEIRAGKVRFHFAFSGAEALEYLLSHDGMDVVLILSDINMPGMSGLELLCKIKAARHDLRVFMITAYHDEAKRDAAMRSGADDYITKPIDFAELKAKLDAVRGDAGDGTTFAASSDEG